MEKPILLQTRRRFLWCGLFACLSLTAALYLAGVGINPALAADAASEARAINQQVNALVNTSHFDEAEPLAKKGLSLCDEVGDFKVYCVSQFNESLGDIAYARRQYPEALEYQQQALHLRETGLGGGHVLVNRSLQRIGRVYLAQQRIPEAETFFERAVSGYEKLTPPNRELGISLGYLRKIYFDTGRIDMAVAAMRQELQAYQTIGDSEAVAIAGAKANLSSLLARQARSRLDKNDFSAAESALIEAAKLIDPLPAGKEDLFALIQSLFGSVYDKQHRYAEAEPFMLRALEYRSKYAGPNDTQMPTLLSNLALLYDNLSKPVDTAAYAVRAIAWFDENKRETATLGLDLLRLGRAQRQLGQQPDAEAALLRANDVLERLLPESDPQRINAKIEIASLWIDQQKCREAERVLKSALEMEPKLPRPAVGWRSSLLAYLALNYQQEARYADAEQLSLEAVKLEEEAGDERIVSLGQRLTALASIYRRQDRYAEAESALLRSLSLQQPDLERATALNMLGAVYSETDHPEKAEAVLKEALAIRTKTLSADSFLTAETMSNLATIDSLRGDYVDAEMKLRRTLAIVDIPTAAHSINVALYVSLLSQTLVSEGKLDEADVLIERALELYRERLGTDHPRFGGALKTLAAIELIRGQDRNAEEHYREALAIDEKMIGPKSPAVAADLMNLVPVLKRAGNRQDAKADIDRAIAINTTQFGADSPITARSIQALADMAYESGKYLDARQLADQARQIREQAFGPDHLALATGWIFLTQLDIAQGKLDDADSHIDRAAIIAAKVLPPDSFLSIDVLQGKANLARARGKPADAEQYGRDALRIAGKLYEPDHPIRRNAIDRLVGVLWVQGKFDDAERLQREALADVERQRGPDHPSIAVATRGIAGVLGNSGRQGEAISLFHRALAIDEQSFGARSDQAARDHFALGSLFRRMGQFEGAQSETNLARNIWEGQGHLLAANSSLEQLALIAFNRGSPAESVVLVERAADIAEQSFGPDSPALVPILAELGRFYIIAGRNDAAEKILSRVNGLIGDNPSEQAPGYLGVLQLRAQLNAERGNIDEAEATFVRAIAVATKYGGLEGDAVGNNSFNLAQLYLKAGRFNKAVTCFVKALDIFKRENGDRSPIVGYTLMGAAQAYGKIGDKASSKALYAAALDILGPTIAAQKPQPKWL
ncbi:tetratricopeptide repeat protein [Bradyrhizobium sp. S69]|uniref:tetratricopeptide repeat protein n=1 Tax=Bradyrhizobium sp. S69 TaxID=1641856 RepID=UPI00131AA648|nr:tetratricopeptide repeat protein [Bradyrhizobium sp. S69]